jgi:hypothetical protein
MLDGSEFPIINTLWILFFLCWAIVNCFWCLQMQNALKLVSPNNKMPAQNVWLVYIPFFGLVWQFMIVNAVSDSLGEEYHRRNIIPREARPGYSTGLSANILLSCILLPAFGILIGLISNITKIIHLNKIKNYCSDLERIIQTQSHYPQEIEIPSYHPSDFDIPLEEEYKKNNPERFMPPGNPEQDYERWRKK